MGLTAAPVATPTIIAAASTTPPHASDGRFTRGAARRDVVRCARGPGAPLPLDAVLVDV
jgi:hypothetical protein